MDKTEIQGLKIEMEKILPKKMLEDSKELNGSLILSIENYQRVSVMADVIARKVETAKRILEKELEDLIDRRTNLIKENTEVFNNRSENIRAKDLEILAKENQIGSLNLTIEANSAKINAVQKTIDSMIFEKNQLGQELTEFTQYLQKLRSQEQEIKNTIFTLNTEKAKASQSLVDAQAEVEKAQNTLKLTNNEILITKDRLSKLNK